jgi:L,D-peptidoglycan transpeptidase YkuD (ErfK/YbiS/YcfS/YnhG family)
VIFQASADGDGTTGWLSLGDRRVRCALGKDGVTPAAAKREGDGASPAGTWPIRELLYRPDRGARPETALPARAISPDDGWCDAPDDPAYNRLIKRPHAASHETIWREDRLYDRVIVLGYNDDPVVPGKGSAIFLHIAREGYLPTEGCVAVSPDDMDALLAMAKPGDAVAIEA